MLSGGEATLHPNFLDLLSIASDNIPMVSFGSNGIRLAKGSLAKDVKSVAPRVLVTISIDSLIDEIHNLNRGKGARLAKMAVEKCLQAGIDINISCVVTESNVDDAHNIVQKYIGDISKFSFFPKVPRNNSEKYQDYKLFMIKFNDLMKKIKMIEEENPNANIMIPKKPTPKGDVGSLFSGKNSCGCVVTKAYITSELNVYPCYYGAHPNNLYGNASKATFKEIWSGHRAEMIRQRAFGGSLCGLQFFSDTVPTRFDKDIYNVST